MVGISDHVGELAVHYFKHHGPQAQAAMNDDLSRAFAKHDGDAAHLLIRVKLRFERLQWLGRFDDATGPTARARALVADQRRRRAGEHL